MALGAAGTGVRAALVRGVGAGVRGALWSAGAAGVETDGSTGVAGMESGEDWFIFISILNICIRALWPVITLFLKEWGTLSIGT